jgi:glyoxylase-like metal-dependent hydrolase (beta-lactamase superfamily II)
VFTDRYSMKLNNTPIELQYYGPAHTDSDISVHLADLDIVHTGDTFWDGIYPFIDYSTGGSIDGQIRAAEANLKLCTKDTIIIPGHGGPVSNRTELKNFHDMLVAIRENVATLKRQGRTLNDIIAARPTAAFDAKWGQFVIAPPLFTKLVYEGV